MTLINWSKFRRGHQDIWGWRTHPRRDVERTGLVSPGKEKALGDSLAASAAPRRGHSTVHPVVWLCSRRWSKQEIGLKTCRVTFQAVLACDPISLQVICCFLSFCLPSSCLSLPLCMFFISCILFISLSKVNFVLFHFQSPVFLRLSS